MVGWKAAIAHDNEMVFDCTNQSVAALADKQE